MFGTPYGFWMDFFWFILNVFMVAQIVKLWDMQRQVRQMLSELAESQEQSRALLDKLRAINSTHRMLHKAVRDLHERGFDEND